MSENLSIEKINEIIAAYERSGKNPSCPAGTLPLHFACDEGKAEVVKVLIARGADVNAQNAYHFTPLHVICSGWGNVECARLLLEAGANPDLKESNAGMTPLLWAAAKANTELVKLLLAHGADTEIRNNEGRTALETVRINYAYSANESKKAVIDMLEKAAPKDAGSGGSHGGKGPGLSAPGKPKAKKAKTPLSKGKKRLLTVLSVVIVLLAVLLGLNYVYLSASDSTVDPEEYLVKDMMKLGSETRYNRLSMIYSADGKSFLTAEEAAHWNGWTIRKWDSSTGELEKEIKTVREYIDESGYRGTGTPLPLSLSCISPDQKQAAVLDLSSMAINAVDTGGKKIDSGGGHNILRYSPDGKHIIFGMMLLGKGEKHPVVLVDAQTGSRTTVRDDNSSVSAIEISPDSSLAAVTYFGSGSVYLYDLESGKLQKKLGGFFDGHRGTIYALSFSRDGSFLAAASSDTVIKLWDISSGKCVETIGDNFNSPASLSFSPDGNEIAAVNDNMYVKIWKVPESCRK